MNALFLLAIPALSIVFSGSVLAAVEPPGETFAGEVKATLDGREISLPMLKTDYTVRIDDTLATVTLKQVFLNPHQTPLNATYLFPLNRKAAVYAMTMRVGNEHIEATIQTTSAAKEIFETAQSAGKAAAMLEQHRPNMFTQSIANLMPGSPVTVTLKYTQTIPKVDGTYELVLPLVVGPRYEGPVPDSMSNLLGMNLELPVDDAEHGAAQPLESEMISGWTVEALPAYPPVVGLNAPLQRDADRVSLSLNLRASVPIYAVSSSTHDLDIETRGTEASATLADGRVVDNKDFVLRYELGRDNSVAAGVLSHHDQRGGFLSLQVEPPNIPAQGAAARREVVFVVDTSGSMSGAPLNASKTFMRAALEGLRPDDWFRILRFSDNTTQYSQSPLPATPANVRDGISFVNAIAAGGGTQMNAAINTAFDLPPLDNTIRIVVFLTDGYIGADRKVIQTVAKRIGHARIYAFGVGNAVNRYLLEGLAEAGRGRARYIEVGEDNDEVATALAQSINAPVLTDVEVDWNGLHVTGQSPARIPDLFAGGSLNILARYQTGGPHKVFLRGKINGRDASLPLDIMLEDTSADKKPADSALPMIWAREQVFDLEREYTISGGKDKRLKDKITNLGLEFSLQTAFTSFVAVSKTIYNRDPKQAKDVQVPLPQVSGVSRHAYPTLNLGGASTPEPETVFGLAVGLMLLLARFRRTLLVRVQANIAAAKQLALRLSANRSL